METMEGITYSNQQMDDVTTNSSSSAPDSVGEAFKPFIPLISTSNAVMEQILEIFQNAEYNKNICNVFLDRVDFALAYIKTLERKKEENQHLFRDENYYKYFVRFTTVLSEIKTFLKDITHLSGYSKYNSAKNFEEMFGNLTREVDTVMNNLKFKMIVTPEDQRLIDQKSLNEDHEKMKKFWESIDGGIVVDKKQMNTSLQEVLIIKTQVESKESQESNTNLIKAAQISPTNLQEPLYPKKTDFRGKKAPLLCKKILNDTIEVACQPITIPDETNLPADYQIVQTQLAILGKLHDSTNILRFYGLSTVEDGIVMVLEWAEMGGLDDVYNNYEISWPDKVSIALEICRGLTFLHSCKILHHDIRCGNIVEPKITNFDYARDVQGATRELKNLTVVVHWLAPEKLLYNFKQSYNFKCEIFSFGMLLWELGFERIPYDKWDMPQIREHVLSEKREEITFDNSNKEMLKLQKEYAAIFVGAWQNDPTLRLSLQQIFFQLNQLANTYHKSSENTPFQRKKLNPDGSVVRSKYSISISDKKESSEPRKTTKSGSIRPIIPLEEGLKAHKNREREKAWACFSAHAELGSPLAKYWKGYYMYEGYCGRVDKAEAIKLFHEAADEGSGDAQLRYAFSLVNNKNFDKDLFIRYLTLSADNGNTTARFNLGDLYYNGKLGAPKDVNKGINFLKLAALDKHPKATELLNKLKIDVYKS
ncbi:12237_t:CDS:2 [Entrophospora sp. SA101]|nr:12237_t:CDS:2 [Entrophospora sp. SA101]